MTDTCNTWVVIPAFNESAKISEVVRDVLGSFAHVVVVDDGSVDDTGAQARAAGASIIVHPINLGQGAALQTGMEFALRQGARWLVTLDADGQHDPADACAMLAFAREHALDVCLGSRFLGRTEGMTTSRRLLLKLALAFQTVTSGVRLTDAHNGLRVLSANAARRIRLRQNRMAHASEIIDIIAREKLRFREFPVTIRYTSYSKAKGQTALGALNIVVDLLLGRLGK